MLLNPLTQLFPATVALTAAALYGAGAAALRGSRSPWPRLRTALFLAGVGVIAAGFLVPGLLGDSVHDPRVHMSVHLLMGMVGPLLVALSAPVTLAFRALRRPARQRLAALLGSPAIRVLGHPITAVVLSVGGLYVLYMSPLHARTLHDPAVGLLVQAHVVLAGTLYAWAIVGVDHVPHRPSVAMRGAALLVGLLLHTILSRLLFAEADRLATEAGGTAADWSKAAEIMWYEGDLVELTFLITFVAQAGRLRRPRPKPAMPKRSMQLEVLTRRVGAPRALGSAAGLFLDLSLNPAVLAGQGPQGHDHSDDDRESDRHHERIADDVWPSAALRPQGPAFLARSGQEAESESDDSADCRANSGGDDDPPRQEARDPSPSARIR